MPLLHCLRKLLWRAGFDIVKFDAASSPLARRKCLLKHHRIDLVLDVGANVGQYAMQVRQDLGFTGEIISFEPQANAFETLQSNACKDEKWKTLNIALGDSNGQRIISVAQNSLSSSLLEMRQVHVDAAPESKIVSREPVQVRTLDSIFDELDIKGKKPYLKVDTQGFERAVLEGASDCLKYIDIIQLEMSLTPLYEGETLFFEMSKWMVERGYSLIAIENGFTDLTSGQLLQVDGIFQRQSRQPNDSVARN